MHDLTAVIWDFDGTLVDTRQKNLNVTRALVQSVKGRPADEFPALASLSAYETALQQHDSWKDFYRLELGMSERQMLDAGSRWMEYQLRDDTAAPFFDGVPEVLSALDHVPHGIVSLNATPNIERFLRQLELDSHFEQVLGYDAVALDRQKPEPDALLLCIERLTDMRPGRVLFVGDHEVDMRCAHNAAEVLTRRGVPVEVLAVGALYGPNVDGAGWESQPHFAARDPRDILGYVDVPAVSLG